jgi:hypothetical protein
VRTEAVSFTLKVSYDNNGNTLTDPGRKNYTWDFENRLVSEVVPVSGTGYGAVSRGR